MRRCVPYALALRPLLSCGAHRIRHNLTYGYGTLEADTGAGVRNALRATIGGADEGRSQHKKQLGARVRLESLTYI